MGQQLEKACCNCAGPDGEDDIVTKGPWNNATFIDAEKLEPSENASPCKRRADGEPRSGASSPNGRPGSPVGAEAGSPADSAFSTATGERVASQDGSGGADAADDLPGATAAEGDETVDAALAQTELLMKDYDILEAEALLARTLDKLCGIGLHEAADRLRNSALFQRVSEFVAQYDATIDMVFNDKFETLYESEDGKFELLQGGPTWYEYRITVNVDAPLAECLATEHELDLVPKAQPMLTSEPIRIGPNNGFLKASLANLPVLFLQVDLLLESLRVRDRRSGFLVESVRSSFPANGRQIPKQGWRSVRPWIFTANLWLPRGGGKKGTCLVQVARIDTLVPAPRVALQFTFRHISKNYMHDLRRSIMKAMEDDSPWAERICEDETKLYSELWKIDEVASRRPEMMSLPEKEFFEREWRLKPKPYDARPPSVK